MKYFSITLCFFILLGNFCWAGEKLELKDKKDRISYSIGYQVGGDFKNQGMELNAEAVLQGIKDGADSSAQPLIPSEEMHTILLELKKNIDARLEESRKKAAEKYRGEGRAFLTENAKKEGVVTLPSGLQYLVLKEGSGRMPKPEDTVTVAYRGTLINGREFDSSYRDNKPAVFRLDSVILGWQQALPMMKEGAQWKLFIPSDLAFGERGPLADKVVIYELELISVQPLQNK